MLAMKRPTPNEGDQIIEDGARFRITHICEGWEYEFAVLDKRNQYEEKFYSFDAALRFLANDANSSFK